MRDKIFAAAGQLSDAQLLAILFWADCSFTTLTHPASFGTRIRCANDLLLSEARATG
jgi:hypothetical protein